MLSDVVRYYCMNIGIHANFLLLYKQVKSIKCHGDVMEMTSSQHLLGFKSKESVTSSKDVA